LGSNNTSYQLTKNIGNSVAQGVEAYVNVSLIKLLLGSSQSFDFRLLSSLAYTHAHYTSGSLSNGVENISLIDKRVENVPDFIQRGGFDFRTKNFSSRLQVSYVSDQYSDANNTQFTSTGIVGYIPAYTLMDWAFNWSFMKSYHLSGGVNNLSDVRYFSRRINMYPGPGILPGDGRSFYLTLGFKLD
jgi:Fe(3+) dicitrate transport protein